MRPSYVLDCAEAEGMDTIEVVERQTGKTGVANTATGSFGQEIDVFYGAEDGSEDCRLSREDFDRRFRVTTLIRGLAVYQAAAQE